MPADTQTEHLRVHDEAQRISILEAIETRLRWLASWTIHHANHLRQPSDGLKVGGHQASCASMSAIMATLYFDALGPNDRIAVKPHAGPLLHALHYMRDEQALEKLKNFRGFAGMQSYPSRTKDTIPVDFSTGSVGLGVAVTAFASLVQDFLTAHGTLAEADTGRMIALMGDAELDEGNIYECLIEGYKHNIRNCWWIVDYNRQSLDATTADRMFRRFDDIFETCGWRVVTLKHGRLQRAAFAEPGGEALREWIDTCPNAEYAALTYQGGAQWRERLTADLRGSREIEELLSSRNDKQLARLMTNLGGHCVESLSEAFRRAADDIPTLFIAYTVKGYGLPLAGHKDNHAGLMTPKQIAELRSELNIAEGDEWAPYAGLGDNLATHVEALVRGAPIGISQKAAPEQKVVLVPSLPPPEDASISTQAAFGKILFELAKSDSALADRIITTSPDVTVSTNLGGWVNQRGLFRSQDMLDVFKAAKIPSTQKWEGAPAGQHVELGIAENNLFLMLAATGLANELFGHRLLPIGTVYDPFIARGLDALNYGCYQNSRFLLVATPSGITLGPEGGAHQSINPPLIAMGQPGLRHYEPAYADELAIMMERAFSLMQEPDGEAVYLRLSTRPLVQIERGGDKWQADALKGGYWLREPFGEAEAAIVYMGVLAPEALAAWEAQIDDLPGLGLLAVTSPDLLHREWSDHMASRWIGTKKSRSHIENLLSKLSPSAKLVTLVDGAPASLSWLGGVRGHRVNPLGVDRFGQTGNLQDLYREYRLDTAAIIDATAELFCS